MFGLDVTDSPDRLDVTPESDAMANAPAEAPVRTGPQIPGHPGLRRITHICGLAVPDSPDRDSMVDAPAEAPDAMVDAPADRLACFPGAARKKPKKDADRELED